MSFNKFKEIIEENDTVILYVSIGRMHAIKVVQQIQNRKGEIIENIIQTKYGALKVKSLIGQKFGSKVALSKGWAYVLHPTPELWTLTLPHRTQIIYTPDISLIILQLEIKPGSIVIESGTGSGSLSHALIRTIKPDGHLFSFDFHELRVNVATKEFDDHGIGSFVTIQQRDVCENGFGESLSKKADAVFLDLPHPWEAIPHAVSSIKISGGRLVSFSPCIEQTQRTCEMLSKCGFVEISTMESIKTEHTVLTKKMCVLNFSDDEDEDVIENPHKKNPSEFITDFSPFSMPGHTGYITAASLPPMWARKRSEEIEKEELPSSL